MWLKLAIAKLTILSLGTVKIIIPPTINRYRVIVNHYRTTYTSQRPYTEAATVYIKTLLLEK